MSRTLTALVVTVLCLAACQTGPADEPAGDEGARPPVDLADGDGDEDERPVVVSTSGPLADLARHVLGANGTVHVLPPLGDADEDARPEVADLVRLADADLVVASGLFLDDEWTEYAEINLREDARLLRLADDLVARDQQAREVAFSQGRGVFQAHLWTDVTFAMDHVEQIRDALVAVDPEGAQTHRANAAAYLEDLEALDRAIAEATATIPEDRREVLVAGDSWEPFGHRYGLTIIRAVPVSDWSDPSEADIGRLVEQARDLGVPAVFGSEALEPSAAATLAEETGAAYVAGLLDVGPRGQADAARSFVGMMVHSTGVIVDRLGGDRTPLDGLGR